MGPIMLLEGGVAVVVEDSEDETQQVPQSLEGRRGLAGAVSAWARRAARGVAQGHRRSRRGWRAGVIGRGGLTEEALGGRGVAPAHGQVHRATLLDRHRVDERGEIASGDIVAEAVHGNATTTRSLKCCEVSHDEHGPFCG